MVIRSVILHRPETEIRVFVDVPRVPNAAQSHSVQGHAALLKGLKEILPYYPQLRVTVRQENMGTQENLVSALDSIFEDCDFIAVLEDDCIPTRGFFDFMDFAESIFDSENSHFAMATGSNHLFFPMNSLKHSALSSSLSHVWGWGLTVKQWKPMRAFIKSSPTADEIASLVNLVDRNLVYKVYKNHWKKLLENRWEDLSWDLKLQFWLWHARLKCLTPGKNLIQNVGFDEVATNSSSIPDHYQNRPTAEFKAERFSRIEGKALVFWELSGFRVFAELRGLVVSSIRLRAKIKKLRLQA
jgi:hypothetical protein